MYTGNEIWESLLNTLTSPKDDDNKAQTLTKAQAIVLLIYPLTNVDFTDDLRLYITKTLKTPSIIVIE